MMMLSVDHSAFSELFSTPAPQTIYHYTSADAFLSIARSGIFWATDARYLNDTREICYAFDVISQEFRAAIDSSPDPARQQTLQACLLLSGLSHGFRVFVASFSAEPDLLSQWRAYCPSTGGFAIGVSSDAFANNPDTVLVPAIYDLQRQKALVRAVINAIDFEIPFEPGKENRLPEGPAGKALAGSLGRCVVRPLTYLSGCFKAPSFSEEKEWRVVTYISRLPSIQGDGSLSYEPLDRLRFRVGKTGFIPHIELTLLTTTSGSWLRDLVVGPALHMHLSTNAVNDFLKEGLHLSVTARPSAIPFRA